MSIDYVAIIGNNFPSVHVECHGDPSVYTNIVHIIGDPLPTQNELDTALLSNVQTNQIEAMSQQCAKMITSGFSSAALGSDHWYDSEEVDQLNLIGATTTTSPSIQDPNGTSIYYACRQLSNGQKTYTLHTHEQLRQVLSDGAIFKLAMLQKFFTKKQYILGLTSIAAIENVSWDSTP